MEDIHITDSFVSGSHAYGTPTESSDIDLVVLVDNEQTIWSLKKKEDITPRFGNLNIIAFSNKDNFEKWRATTNLLKEKAPVTREEAVEAFKRAGFEGYGK